MKLRTPLFFCMFAAFAAAQAPATARKATLDADKDIKLGVDEPGCKDSAILRRIPGCNIIQCDVKEADRLVFHVGASTEGVPQTEEMDGPSEVLYFLCPAKVSPASIVKQSEAALVKSGFKTVFNGKDDDELPVVTLLKGADWVQISTYTYNEYSAYVQTAVKAAPEASSEAMLEEIAKTGRVVLYGLDFEKANSDLPAGAERILSEVAAFLVRQPDMKIRVEGHSDDASDKPGNLTLSKQRASAVAAWLLEHGIDRTRVAIDGVGDAKPDASGDGAKNLRIEIVKM